MKEVTAASGGLAVKTIQPESIEIPASILNHYIKYRHNEFDLKQLVV